MTTKPQGERPSPSAVEGLRLLWNVCESHLLRMLALTLRTERHNPSAPLEDGPASADDAPERRLLRALRFGLHGNMGPYDLTLTELGRSWSQANVDLQIWHEAIAALREEMLHALILAYAPDPVRMELSLSALQRIVDRTTQILTKAYLRESKGAGLAQDQLGDAALRRLTKHSELDRKRLEESHYRSRELEVQNASICESSRRKSMFLANMSHELRTPLNSVIGFAELLVDGIAEDAAQQREFLGYILKSGRHLLEVINEVLDLAKVESGTMCFQPEPIDLGQLVAEVCDGVQPLAASKRIHFVCSIEPKVNQLTLDPARLRQVLYNYVSNAIKFSNTDSTVHIRARTEKIGRLRLEVVDSGLGISQQDLDRLFVEFQQLDAGAGRNPAGTGLGLALTKRIVEAQGGCVGVESKLGKGSTFVAVLPCHLREAAPFSREARLNQALTKEPS